mgnify:CR=1 FL=1
MERVPTKGGSIRSTVQLSGGPRTVAPSVSAFIKDEETLGIHSPEIFDDFSNRIDRAKTQLVQLIRQLMDQGKTIAGYGASQSGTTLMYHFGLQESLSFIVDDNPVKQGLYSPGCHIPVVPSAELETRKRESERVLSGINRDTNSLDDRIRRLESRRGSEREQIAGLEATVEHQRRRGEELDGDRLELTRIASRLSQRFGEAERLGEHAGPRQVGRPQVRRPRGERRHRPAQAHVRGRRRGFCGHAGRAARL